MPSPYKTQAIAILGTGSDVGKTVVAAGLCRLLHRAGVRVAPFKAQNMSLNSFVTPEGGEIGRAQALQAQACGLLPHVDMNPILLKPESDSCAQVIVHGKVWGKRHAAAYFEDQRELIQAVRESYDRLAEQYDVVVIEGAGSAAEINLRDRDLVNWPMVQLADAKVVLVADIDRGGVFAQIIGTLDLLAPEERARVCGIVINRFRGDAGLFADGVQWLEQRTRIPILGVLPFLRDLVLDQEDSLEPPHHTEFCAERVNIAVVLLPRMSNFTDFNSLIQERDVVLRYAAHPEQLVGADVVVLPGSKNTQADLGYLREKGLVQALHSHVHRMGELVGICGGFQMLGQRITDPHGVEAGGDATGLGYLRMETELRQQKQTAQVDACPADWISPESIVIRGYHIHMGVATQLHEQPCFFLLGKDGQAGSPDGAVREDGLVWGTYIHGVFDHPRFRRAWLNRVRIRKDLLPIGVMESEMTTSRMAGELDRWTDHLAKYVNTTPLFNLLQSQTA